MNFIYSLILRLYYKIVGRKVYQIRYHYYRPPVLKEGFVYVEGRKNDPWLILLICPCGCKGNIELNLDKEIKPFWKYEIIHGRIFISPSIRRTLGCKSHFFIKSSRVVWC